uniref:Fem-1 homolog b n=1 Tax=Neogobius melanostomus TaxID=47308 RepID=A0A8C6S3I6_9GOBI
GSNDASPFYFYAPEPRDLLLLSQMFDPLIYAARYGHYKTVELLLNKYGEDTEQMGTSCFNGVLIHGVTALWCAAKAGHFEVVRLLIPACFKGHMDIVQYLVEHQADINIVDNDNTTCLMVAGYQGHTDVVRFLLERGADLNAKCHDGLTALHFAAARGHMDIVRELVSRRATVVEDKRGMTPLKVAADRCQADVVEFLLAYLLGASFANDQINYDIQKTFHYLHAAMTERYRDPQRLFPKERLPHIEAYGLRRECKSLEELENIRVDHDALHMEGLMIRERILGSDNILVPNQVFYRGTLYANRREFDNSIQLWLHALWLTQRCNCKTHKALLIPMELFYKMVHLHKPLNAVSVEQVMSCSVLEIQRSISRVDSAAEGKLPQALDNYKTNIFAFLYLSCISTKTTCGEEQRTRMNKHIYDVIKMDPRSDDGSTLLHLAVSPGTQVNSCYTKDVCIFPNAQVVKLLLECGAQVDAVDHEGNTPLHVIVQYDQLICDLLTLHTIITSLVEAGAHTDMANKQKKTPLDMCSTSAAKDLLKSQMKMSLQCLAARAVRKHSIPYRNEIPKTLEEFTEFH